MAGGDISPGEWNLDFPCCICVPGGMYFWTKEVKLIVG